MENPLSNFLLRVYTRGMKTSNKEIADKRLEELERTGYQIQTKNNPLKGKSGRLATKIVDGEKFEELVEWYDWEPELAFDCKIIEPIQFLDLLDDPKWVAADAPTSLLLGLTHKTSITRFVRYCRLSDVQRRKGMSPDECEDFIAKRNKKMGK